MMRCIAALLLLTAVAAQQSNSTAAGRPKVAVTRTALHIARSLDPSETELLSVKSRTGEMATLIVKRREGRKTPPAPEAKPPARIQDAETLLRAGKARPVPRPVEIRSATMLIKDEGPKKRGRTLTIDSDGVPVIEGVREPDTEEDKKQTWRNARVINGVLVPYKQALTAGPVKSKGKPEKQEVSLSSSFETKPSSMFSEHDAVRTQWKGIAETMPAPNANPESPNIIDYIMKINKKELEARRKQGRSMERRMDENVDENDEPLWVNTQTKEVWTEHGKVSVADRRSDLGEEDGPEARLLHPQGVSSFPESSLYSTSRVSFEEGVRTPVLQYAHPELGVQPARAQDSKEAESTTSEDPSRPALSYFSDDPYADRSPYAYEPGLSEDTLTANSKFHAPDVANSLGEGRRHTSVHHIEFTTSAPQSIDQIDITEPPRKYEHTYGLAGDKYIKRYPYSGYYPGGGYPMTKDEYYKWKMSGMSYGNGHKGGYVVKIPDNRPFWEKLTDSIRETVQSGVESMKDLTRPVMEPLVEATQRISENLGLPGASAKLGSSLGFGQGTGMRTAIQEKIGDVAASPVLLPALGLVAGGAALGLGAVAVGKILDVNPVNLLKRSEDGDDDGLQMEHKRALAAVEKAPAPEENLVDPRHLPAHTEVDKPDTKTDFKRLIDESGIEGLERFNFNVHEGDAEHKSRRRSLGPYPAVRRRRSPFDLQRENQDYLDNLLTGEKLDQEAFIAKMATLGHPNAWSNTACAKKMFCDAMVRQSHDAAMLMEKKMATFLSLITPPVADSVAFHLHDVMTAVHLQDCSRFACRRLGMAPR